MSVLIEQYKKMNKKILNYNVNDKTKARVFHLMNTDALFNQVVGVWESLRIEGLSPELTIEAILSEIHADVSIFDTKDLFDQRIEEWKESYFYTSKEISDTLKKAIVSRAILVCAHHFYIELSLEKFKDEILTFLHEENILFRVNEKDNSLYLYGRPSKKSIDRLNQFSNVIETNNKQFVITKSEGQSWYSCFTNKNNWKCTSDFLYSGVNIGIKRIEMLEENMANRDVQVFKLSCVQTTYLTRMGIGITAIRKPYYQEKLIHHHPFLLPYEDFLDDFESKEIKLQDNLFKKLNEKLVINEDTLASINDYLCETDYLPIISVAGNIETADDFIICVKRGKNLESPNTYSCSVNGVTEVYHESINHYKYSDSNDRPSITSDMETFQFENEFNREMMAELGVTQSLSWSIFGLAIFQVPLTKEGEKKNALIFDVIGKTYMPFTLDQVRILQKTAVENKENEKIFGYNFSIFGSQKEQMRSIAFQSLNVVSTHKDLIGFLIVSILFILEGKIKDILKMGISWKKEDIQIIFSFILFIIVIVKFIELKKQKKIKIKQNVIKQKPTKNKYLAMDIVEKHRNNDGKKANIALVLLTELEYLLSPKQ